MASTATLSTVIDPQVKRAATQFCRRRGLKLRYFVEQALVEQLEDEMDLEAYFERRNEETVPLDEVLTGRRKRRG